MLFNILVANCLALAANAHVIMTNPTPYGRSTLQNGPLQADGSDFPCKQRDGVYNIEGASNVYAQGSTQHLAFKGSAVHGGGSCQVSVTTDAHPDKNSVWKVIKSIEGGCPAEDQVGNLGTDPDPNIPIPYTYNYTIPSQLPAGTYTMAWTWHNKIGNREMYMNCAPLQVTGYGGSKDFLNTLPDMFEANISGKDGCTTEDNTDLLYPNPGKDVEKLNGATNAFAMPNCTAKAPTGGYASPPAPSSYLAPPIAPPPQLTALPTPISAPSYSTPTKPVGQPAMTQPLASDPAYVAIPAPVPNPAPTSSTKKPSGGYASGPKGEFPAGTTCDQEGRWNCVDGHSFQRCGSGNWSSVIALAEGTDCKVGQADELQFVSRRSRHALRHILRGLSHS